jgi:hypothetical protein
VLPAVTKPLARLVLAAPEDPWVRLELTVVAADAEPANPKVDKAITATHVIARRLMLSSSF